MANNPRYDKYRNMSDEELAITRFDDSNDSKVAQMIYEERMLKKQHEYVDQQIHIQHELNTENIDLQNHLTKQNMEEQNKLNTALVEKQVKWVKYAALLNIVAIIVGAVLGWCLQKATQKTEPAQQTTQRQSKASIHQNESSPSYPMKTSPTPFK